MKQGVKFLILAVILIGVLVGAYFAYQNLRGDGAEITKATTARETQSAQIAAAADFKVVDKNGNDIHLSDFSGKPTVVNFWTSWCPNCLEEMQMFENFYIERGNEVQVLMVNLTDGDRETLKTANQVIEESHFSFPVFFDTYGEALKTYETYTIPVTLFINSDGTIAEKYVGALNPTTFEQKVNALH